MTAVVISQPMLFPWIGMFEQLRLADVFVHYDDVQFSKGSFTNRVQIKTATGSKWLTVPLAGRRLSQSIGEVAVNDSRPWRAQHRDMLRQALDGAPQSAEALRMLDQVYALPGAGIAEVSIASLERCADYFGLRPARGFLRSSALGIGGSGWQRVLEIVRSLGAERYISGHGGARYLDHQAFEQAGVRVEYMNYERRPYPQLHGPFTPYVSILDLIANCGREGRRCIASGTVPWREFSGAQERA